MSKYLKLSLVVAMFALMLSPVYAAGPNNVTLLYGWNGTNWVPLKVSPDGTLNTDLNLTQAIGINPRVNATYALGNPNLLWASVYAKNISIGSSSSRQTLDVTTGNIAMDQDKLFILNGASTTEYLSFDSSNTRIRFNVRDTAGYGFAFTNNTGTVLMQVNSSGFVGIGTAAPSSLVHVVGTNSANNLTLNVNNMLYLNASAGRVGIGTTRPNALTHVYAGSSGTTPTISASVTQMILQNNEGVGNGTGLTFITGSEGTASIRFGTVSNQANAVLQYDHNLSTFSFSNNNVGIGTTSPTAGLQINTSNPTLRTNGSAFFDGNVSIGTTSSGGTLRLESSGATSIVITSTDNSLRHGLKLATDDTAGIDVYPNTGEVRMGGFSTGDYYPVIYSDGVATMTFGLGATPGVGIGTTNPTARLHVNSTAALTGVFNSFSATGGYIEFRLNESGKGYLGSSALLAGGGSINDIELRSNTYLYLTGTKSNDYGVVIQNTQAAGSRQQGAVVEQQESSALASDAIFGVRFTGGSEKFRVQGTGRTVINSNSTTAGLDVLMAGADDTSTVIARFFANATPAGENDAAYLQISGYVDVSDATSLYTALQTYDLTGTARNLALQPGGGNVGIGTTSPSTLLHVKGATTINGTVAIGSRAVPGGVDVHIQNAANDDAGLDIYRVNATEMQFQAYDRANSRYNRLSLNAKDIDWQISGTSKMLLDSAGKVGIGTTTPSTALDVRASNSTGFIGTFYNSYNGAGGNTVRIINRENSANGVVLSLESGDIATPSRLVSVLGSGNMVFANNLNIRFNKSDGNIAEPYVNALRVDANNVTSVGGHAITIANDADYNLNSYFGFLYVYNQQDNSGAIYFLNANTATANEIYDSSGGYSSTVDTASSINIYVASGNLHIQNKMGATRDLSLTVIAR